MSDENLTVLFTSVSENNPYHDLLFEALEQHDIEPVYQQLPVFLPLTRTVLNNEDVDIIHLGWIYKFYMKYEYTALTILNTIITLGRAFWFCIDLILVRLLNKKVVWTVHNKYHHDRHFPYIERVLNVIVANIVHCITVKCDSAKSTISQYYRVYNDSKITVIPDGSYIDLYLDEITQSEAREKLNIGDEFVYLYFGQIRPYKGVEELIKAFQNIDDDTAELWIVGNPKTETIHECISTQSAKDKRIQTKLEFIAEEDVQLYMNAADVLVLPYRDILNSGSVYLGLSFGKPVIAPKIGCIPEIVPPENELLYSPGENNLLTKLQEAREQNLSETESANLEHAKKLSWDRSAERYLRLYVAVSNMN